MTLLERAQRALLMDRQRAYQLTFELHQPANVAVMEHMARFCRANETCVIPGDRDRTLILEGRREVWLLLQNYLRLTEDQLHSLYSGNPAQPTEKK